MPTFANGRSWPNRDARSATSSSTQCDPLGKLMPRVSDPVCIPRLHPNHFQHEDGTRSIKREQLAAAVSAKAKEAGSVRRNLQVTVTRFDLIGAPQRKVAGKPFSEPLRYARSLNVGDAVVRQIRRPAKPPIGRLPARACGRLRPRRPAVRAVPRMPPEPAQTSYSAAAVDGRTREVSSGSLARPRSPTGRATLASRDSTSRQGRRRGCLSA